jgi:hypothetical protein
LLRQIAFEEPVGLRKVEKSIPEELETIVLKAMEKNPADRYAAAKELAEDLRHWMEDRPIKARRPSLRQVAARWVRRHQTAVVAGAVCLLVILTAVVGSTSWVLGEQRARQHESEASVLKAQEEAAPGLREGNPYDPALVVAVQRARAQLDSGRLGSELRDQAQQLQRDWEMLARLEEASLRETSGRKETEFDYAGADELYAQAFKWYDVDVSALKPGDAAQRIRSSAIRTHLVAGLDDWARINKRWHRAAEESLRALADLADANPWRYRLRQAVTQKDRAALERLVEAEGTLSESPGNLGLLAGALRDVGSALVEERLLRQARRLV